MKHFLIDYENIKADGIKNISDVNKDDVFYIFTRNNPVAIAKADGYIRCSSKEEKE